MLPQLVDLNDDHYRPRALGPSDDDEDQQQQYHVGTGPVVAHHHAHPRHSKEADSAQFMYNAPRSEYSPSPVDNAYFYPSYPNQQPRRAPVYPHLDPINTCALPDPDQLSPFNPNFSGSLSAAYAYSPISPDDQYGPSPPNTGTSTASAPVTLTLTQAPSGNPLPHLPHSLGPSPSETNSKTYSFIPLPGNAVKKRPRRRYDEIERLYQCSWPDCAKAYGTLNHLNAHVTMQKHGAKRSPNEFKELRKQWRKAKKEAEQHAHQSVHHHSLAARRVASMQSLSTSGLSPLSPTDMRRPHTQDPLYDLHHAYAYPSSAPSSSAAGPLAGGYADAVDSPSHYPVSLSQPHASLMHSASIPIAHHQHSNSESRYPLTVPIDFNAPPSPTRQSGVDLDVYAGRQRYGSAPSILWSSTRSTYPSYPQQEQEQHIASYQTDATNNQDAVNFFNMNGMMNVNVALDAAGSRLPADSTLLTPLRSSYDQSQPYLPQQQDSNSPTAPAVIPPPTVVSLGDETRPSTGHASLGSGGEEGY